VFEPWLNLPLLVDVAICAVFAFILAMLPFFSARLASILRLGAGSQVVPLNPTPAKNRHGMMLTLYDCHHAAQCRPLREAIAMLGLDVEIRPCPDPVPGVPSPWRMELEALQRHHSSPGTDVDASTPSSLRLPYLHGLDGVPDSIQGDGLQLAKHLFSVYAAPNVDSLFRAQLFEVPPKVTMALCMVASLLRRHVEFGRLACKVDFNKLNEARDNLVAMEVEKVKRMEMEIIREEQTKTTPSTTSSSHRTTGLTPSPHLLVPSPSPSSSHSKSSAALLTPPPPAHSPSPSPGSVAALSPSHSLSSLSSPSSLRYRLLQRSATGLAQSMVPLRSVSEMKPLQVWAYEASYKCTTILEMLCSLQFRYILHTCAEGSLNRAQALIRFHANTTSSASTSASATAVSTDFPPHAHRPTHPFRSTHPHSHPHSPSHSLRRSRSPVFPILLDPNTQSLCIGWRDGVRHLHRCYLHVSEDHEHEHEHEDDDHDQDDEEGERSVEARARGRGMCRNDEGIEANHGKAAQWAEGQTMRL